MTIDMGVTVFCDAGCGANHYVGELNPKHFADQGRLTDLARNDAVNFGWLLVYSADQIVCVDKAECVSRALEMALDRERDGEFRVSSDQYQEIAVELPLGAVSKADLAHRALATFLHRKTTDCDPTELPFSFERSDLAAWIEGAWPHVGNMTVQIAAAVVDLVASDKLHEESSINLHLPGPRRFVYTTVEGADYGVTE